MIDYRFLKRHELLLSYVHRENIYIYIHLQFVDAFVIKMATDVQMMRRSPLSHPDPNSNR